MTIRQAMEQIDQLVPNQYSIGDKIRWLSKLDGRIFKEIIQWQGCSEEEPRIYTEGTDAETNLLVPWPYDYDIYLGYLEAMIHKYNGENTRYNAAAAAFEDSYQRFADFVIRERKPGHGGRMRF